MNEQRTLTTDNNDIAYSVYGHGVPVVLLHGFAEDSRIWEHQVESLQQDYKLIVIDLPGSGDSSLLPNGSMELYAEAVKNIINVESNEPVALIGHSMGGYITLAFADAYPEMLSGFCLFHSSAYADDEEKINTRRKGIEFIKENGAERFLAQSIPNLFSEQTRTEKPELIKEIVDRYANFSADSLVQYYEAMIARPDRTKVLKKFEKPVLFIAGKHDNAVPMQKTLEQSTMPSFSYIHICNNSGHMGMLEETESCNNALFHFLSAL